MLTFCYTFSGPKKKLNHLMEPWLKW